MNDDEITHLLKARERDRMDKYRSTEKYWTWAQSYYSRPDVISRRRENDAKRYERRKTAKIGGGG